MTTLTGTKLREITRSLPVELHTVLQAMPRDLFLAGGYIASVLIGEEPKDADLFCRRANAAHAELLLVSPSCGGLRPWHQSEKSVTFKTEDGFKIQLVHWRDFTSEQSVRGFDFQHCQAAIWHDGKRYRSICSYNYAGIIAARELVYTRQADDIIYTADRMRKFLQRGWSIDAENFACILVEAAKEIDKRGMIEGAVVKRLVEAES